jgi:hypothetical protein
MIMRRKKIWDLMTLMPSLLSAFGSESAILRGDVGESGGRHCRLDKLLICDSGFVGINGFN